MPLAIENKSLTVVVDWTIDLYHDKSKYDIYFILHTPQSYYQPVMWSRDGGLSRDGLGTEKNMVLLSVLGPLVYN